MRKQKLKDNTFIYTHDKGEYISDYIEQTKWYYEPKTIDYIKSLNLENCTILDVGANIGNHTVAISRFTKNCEIYSFEPYSKNFRVLDQNAYEYKNITCLNAFIDVLEYNNFTVPVYLNPVWGNSNLGYIKESEQGEKISFVTNLNFLIKDLPKEINEINNIKLIKIDTEGNELNVLHGASEILHLFKPIIIAEHHTESEHLEVLSYLNQFGYSLETIIQEDNKNYVYKVI